MQTTQATGEGPLEFRYFYFRNYEGGVLFFRILEDLIKSTWIILEVSLYADKSSLGVF